jgi:hypothetical protein
LAEVALRAGGVWIASLLLLPLIGAPLVTRSKAGRLSIPARFALAAACGAVVLSFVMTVWALAGWHWNLTVLVATGLALCALLRRFLPDSGQGARNQGNRSILERAAIPILILSVAASFVAAASASASAADLLLFWGPKAQAFAAARTIDAGFLRDPFLEYMHASYPPLVTNLTALTSMAAGRFAWGAATLVFPILLTLLAAALPSLLRLAAPPSMAMAAAAVAIAASGFLGDALDIGGNGDMPLLFFEALAAALLVGSWALGNGGQLFAGLMLAGAASTKVEGLPFALGIGLLFLIVRRKEIRWPAAALRLLLPPAFCVATWFAFGAARRLFFGYRGYGTVFEIHWERLWLVLSSIGEALFSAGWALPFLLPLAVLLLTRGRWRLAVIPVGPALLLAGFFVFTYLHGDPNPRLWIIWSAGRIFLPVAVLFTIAAAARAGSEAAA